jgi:hypothetical protein
MQLIIIEWDKCDPDGKWRPTEMNRHQRHRSQMRVENHRSVPVADEVTLLNAEDERLGDSL